MTIPPACPSCGMCCGIWCVAFASSCLGRAPSILRLQDRVYTKSANVPEIWDAGLNAFIRHIVHAPIQDHVIAAVLTLIQTERDGYTINRSSVKGCVDVFLQLYVPEGRDSQSIYKRDIEPAVKRESEAFYKKEGERLLETCDAPEYLKRGSAACAF